MPIGLTGGGDYFALSLASGAIYLWRHELDVDGDEQSLTFLEPDVNSLLNSIEDSEEDLGGDEIEEVIKSGSVLRIEGYLRQNPIDRKNKIGYSLVQEAARAGNLAIVKYCLQQGASCKGLMCAGARSERREVIDYLLDEVGLDVNDPDEDGRTPLSYVVFDDEIHDYLVSRGAHE
jgi:hypothetical protein